MADPIYAEHMKELWELAGEIGTLGETQERYARVYMKLSDALDEAEASGLITYPLEEGDESVPV